MRISNLTCYSTYQKLCEYGFDSSKNIDVSQDITFTGFLNQSSCWNGTPLCYAAGTGDVQMINGLYSAGANLEACDEEGDTPLLIAIREGRSQAVKLLLDLGAKIDHHNIRQYAPDISPSYALAQGKNRYAWHVSFFVNQFEKRIMGRDVNYDQTEQILNRYGLASQ